MDPIIWTPVAPPSEDGAIWAAAGIRFDGTVLLGSNGHASGLYTTHDIPGLPGSWFSRADYRASCIICSDSIFLVFGPYACFASLNAEDFEDISSEFSNGLPSKGCWDGTNFITATENADGQAYISTDGASWVSKDYGAGLSVQFCKAGGGKVIIGGASSGTGNTQFSISTNHGVSWTLHDDIPDWYEMHGMAYYNGLYVAAVYSSGFLAAIITSSDGINWTQRYESASEQAFKSVIHDGEKFIAGGAGFYAMSLDGLSWESFDVADTTFLLEGLGGFKMALGPDDQVLISGEIGPPPPPPPTPTVYTGESHLKYYQRLLLSLLPTGPLWDRLNSTTVIFIEALAREFARVHDLGLALLRESIPATSTASLMLSEWEQIILLPEEMPLGTETEEERQQVVGAKLLFKGGQSRAFFIGLAASLGITITIVEDSTLIDPARVDTARVDSARTNDSGNVFLWEIQVDDDPSSHLDKFKLMIERLKPAHTSVIYS